MSKLRRFCLDNGLTLVFVTLFLLSLLGQVLSGTALYNQTQRMHGLAPAGYGAFARTGVFMQGVFSNWQAAILQLGSLVVFGVFLRQRGAPHSRRLGKTAPGRISHGLQKGTWLHRNSFSLTFALLFLAAFAAHLFSGAAAYNQTLALEGQPRMGVASFLFTAKFWFSTFQTWEAEYMAIALYVELSIFLRQAGSPESKPTEASDRATGVVNE